MKIHVTFLFFLFASGISVATSHAAEAIRISEREAIALALEKSTPALESAAAYASTRADALEVHTLENPEFQIGAMRERDVSGVGVDAEIYQPLRLSDLTRARSNFSDSLKRLADDERSVAQAAIIAEASAAYSVLWAAQARKKLFTTARRDARRTADILTRETEQGRNSVAALDLFLGDVAGWDAKLAANDADIAAATLTLSRLTGRDMTSVILADPELFALPPVAELIDQANQNPNWRNLLSQKLEVTQRRLRLALDDGLLPEIGPRVTYAREADGAAESYGFGISMRVPLWNTNKGEQQRAGAEIVRLEGEISRAENYGLSQSISSLHQQAIASIREYELLDQSVLPRYRRSYKATQTLLIQGQADAMLLWQVREKLVEAEQQRVDSLLRAHLAKVELLRETGDMQGYLK